MTFFVENGLAIAVAGGLAITLTLVFFMARRTGGSLSALAAAVAATIVLLAIERFVQTDREQVASAVHNIYAAIDQNDVNGVLTLVDPSATQIRADVQALMPMVKVESAGSHDQLTGVSQWNSCSDRPSSSLRQSTGRHGVGEKRRPVAAERLHGLFRRQAD
jgi:hypothetical protein